MAKEPIFRPLKEMLIPVMVVVLFGMVWGVVLTLFVQNLFRH
jgi:hypothetical protein